MAVKEPKIEKIEKIAATPEEVAKTFGFDVPRLWINTAQIFRNTDDGGDHVIIVFRETVQLTDESGEVIASSEVAKTVTSVVMPLRAGIELGGLLQRLLGDGEKA